MKFNELASTLDDIEGGFEFYVTGYWGRDLTEPGRGSININYTGGRKTVEFINSESGNATDNIYSKKGVWNQHHKDGKWS